MSSLRVALAGTMANNLYNACCNLRMCGVEATLFLDGSDKFAMGQPVWEEAPLRIATEELKRQHIDFDAWMALSTKHIPDDGRLCIVRAGVKNELMDGARTPLGHVYRFTGDVSSLPSPDSIVQRALELARGLPVALTQQVMNMVACHIHLIRCMATCDVVVVSQFRECILAALTGKPVRYIVYGADWRYILDNVGHKSGDHSRIFEHFLKHGNIVHGVFNWEDIMHISFRHGLAQRWLHCDEPIINIANATRSRNRQALRQRLGLGMDDFVVLLPSRIDTRIKKTDMLFRAFSTFAQEAPHALLITAGWGKDLEDMAHQFPLQNIRFLDHVMSKPLLFDYMSAADMVADQFSDGAIGSTGREALAVGRPLLAFVNSCFHWSWGQPSPILNSATEEDILRWLRFARAHPQEMEERGAQGRQWLLSHMNTGTFARELCVLAEHGAEKTLSYAPVLRSSILDCEIDCPRGQCSLQVSRWPWPYSAGLSISNDCEYYTWEHFCALHRFMANRGRRTPWGIGLGLPFSDSFWFYDDSASGFSWFKCNSFTPSVHAPFMEALVRAGVLDTIHAWGEFDATSSFTREHALRAADCLAALEQKPDIFTNHGSSNNRQNVGGRFAQPYHQGDVPDASPYHTDILRDLGVRWFWGDEGCTHQFSMHATGELLPEDGVYRADAFPWSGQLLYRNKLRDGQHTYSFRRMRGTLPKAPTASSLAQQIKPAYLDHLEATRGGACIYQHLGCWRDMKGIPRPFRGEPFPREALRALGDIAHRYHTGRIWVAPLKNFLRYVHAVQHVVVEPFACGDGLELKLWFLSNSLRHEADLSGLSVLVRSKLPVKKVQYEGCQGQWHTTEPRISTLDDGRQLVCWPWEKAEDFPFTGKEDI